MSSDISFTDGRSPKLPQAAAPKVSVVVLTKNPGDIFRQVLEAVLIQQTRFAFDVLVVDSGSTDGTLDHVKSLADPRVRTLQIPPAEFGHGKTRNLAIASTRGQYVAMLTHDALPATPQWLQSLVDVADSDDSIAGVYGRHIAYPDANPFTKRDLIEHFEYFGKQKVVFCEDADRYRADQHYRQVLHFFSDNNALLRRTVWEVIPYPEVDFAEDQVWAKHVIEAGWKKGYSDEGAVYHSHDYAIFEKLQRSFDESFALYRLFGYVLVPSRRHALGSYLSRTRRDFAYAAEAGLWRADPRAVLKMPLMNLMTVAGHYIGARADRLSPWWRRKLSRDRRVSEGLPTSSSGRANA
ncbi:glycosyltransferase family 2 protein [Bordetella genomosp. 9]|uniref:Family 2 glycosyl transferase n=1 Tax=Bordetella genomosp. 9 TaxID=1416803 RepID=A0A1W6Z4E1_9BORD|nr:glycosyltransferase family 2 protein [Bordetella genomosp. 9]ARP88275.1 family 2 glycosyl transferase [Bordetella genomosp. 9]